MHKLTLPVCHLTATSYFPGSLPGVIINQANGSAGFCNVDIQTLTTFSKLFIMPQKILDSRKMSLSITEKIIVQKILPAVAGLCVLIPIKSKQLQCSLNLMLKYILHFHIMLRQNRLNAIF